MKNKINIDGVLSFFILATGIYADYIIYIAKSLPFTWRMLGLALVSLVTLLLFALTFKKMPKWATITRRVIVILFTVIFAFTSVNLDKFRIFTNRVTDVKDKNVETISIVVKNDSKIDELDDLKNKTVYYQDGTDKENAEFAKKALKKDVSKVKFASENNYFTLAQMLMNDEIDALIISNGYIRSVEDGLEGFEASIRVITTYQHEVSKIDKEHTGAGLDLTQDCFTILISGLDLVGDPNQNSRSDVSMLVLVNPKTNHIEMISFPRDAFVPNPALGNINDKLTHTGNDGVENTMEAIEQVVGFDINFYVKINFTSVVEIVDALGGVEVDVPVAFCEQDSQRSFEGQDLQCLEKGVQHVNGEQALAFSRHRKTEGVGDIGRTHAQQKVMMAMIKKALTPSGATKVPAVLDIIPKYVVTNISDEQMNHFISYQLENMKPWTMNNMTLENGYSDNLITASMGSAQPVSCYILNRLDVQQVWFKYWTMLNTVNFKDFSFDLNDLSPENIPDMPVNNDLVFVGDDLSQYIGAPIEVPTEPTEKPTDEPEQPETPVVPDEPEVPVVPEEPTVPEEPEEPETPETPETPDQGGQTTPPTNGN